MNKLYEKLSKDSVITVHSMIAGLAYFMVVLRFIIDHTEGANSGMLLGFLFAPAIICGSALMLIKIMRIWRDSENMKRIFVMAVVHLFIAVIAGIFGIDMLINAI